MKKTSPRTNGKNGQIRIIGGRWRGRKLTVADLPGLRPTTDRVKETVFNWLQFELQQARVLDAFAGTGSLGLEALSRGAEQVIFIEKSAQAARQLQQNLAVLQAQANSHVITTDAIQALMNLQILSEQDAFDVIFLDPPFGQNLLQPCLQLIHERKLSKPGRFIYIETEKGLQYTTPPHWLLYREKQAGQVLSRLYITGEYEEEPL
ncbi:MAG: 16S rRNA (guanine(966)-N(2))-methyltransferase RsmD [Aliidiomarina sp.]|uniref:16S rRNA (guanine(966)-N(2))-methyltransferase RsmD n=1 Tax=Aliidiomarina sp. TaxID=1872439 RepID=UPI0025BF2BE5|nr:16S rRNA (guanine(966)-N(2))-methyltransferase RsmD [Aliidiomarina sp.]MCH8501627.1 16S rRNA (guanine(966)-N(2))-methyltransferase RsmD [Aliidiomarina sp.]